MPRNCILAKVTNAPQPTTVYFPLEHGRYEVKAGLYRFGTDFGNGEVDNRLFQIDMEFAAYRVSKLAARYERLSKYYCVNRYAPVVSRVIAGFMVARLIREHPDCFQCETDRNNRLSLHCTLTGETLDFDDNMQLRAVRPGTELISPAYASSLDAIACQIQEDLAIISHAGHNWVSAIHLCCPNHWAAEDKIGRDFSGIHRPVPGFEKINANANALVEAMISKGPYVRFVWGLATDKHLNHHPRLPRGARAEEWRGRRFDRSRPKLFMRIERQTLWGFPEVSAALFAIRTYFRDCTDIKKDPVQRQKLESAITSMNPDTLRYKGLADSKADILAWLREGP
jgi:dimethylamine monooxygenase subunit A